MAFVTIEDLSGFVETVIFPEVYMAAIDLLKSEEPLLVRGSAQNFKVTYPEDFALAEAILRSRQ